MCPIRSQCCTNYNAPTGNLDSKTSDEVIALLKMTAKKYGQTIVMITHDDEIAQVADRILVIDVGRILRTFKIKKNVEVTDNGKIII